MATPLMHLRRTRLLMAALVAGAGLAVPAIQPAAAASDARTAAGSPAATPEFSPDRVLVRFSAGFFGRPAAAAVEASGGRLGDELFGWRVVEAPGRAADVARRLRGAPGVETVERDHIARAALEPNDTFYPTHQKPYLDQVRMPAAWDATRGSGVVVAVLDSGVDRTHPDLTGTRLLAGRDFINGDNDPEDDNGHGTLVTGVAAASIDNGRGIAGIAGEATMLPVKVLDEKGEGPVSAIAKGIEWAADQRARVINLSLGLAGQSGPAPEPPVLRAAVDYALSKDAVVVAAAGNDGSPWTAYPAAHPGVLAVTAIDVQNRLAYFSDWSVATDVAAPGVNILGTARAADVKPPNAPYGWGTGTSFAAPIVAGVATLIRARSPNLTDREVGDRIRSSATDAGPSGFDPYFGHGILDAAAALGVAGSRAALIYTRDTNDSMPGASALAGSTEGTIHPEGDVDWYYVDVTAPGTLSLTVNPPPTQEPVLAFDPVLQIFDAQGVGVTTPVNLKKKGEPETASALVAAGRYYLKVRNYHGSQSPG
ncbi:MAG: S8 family peptidase, partial [Actinobacteria bacterium]|nr:S8 family peptidase [Actinomycetota bacterium]